MKIKLLIIALFIFCVAASVTAQTSADLQAKYDKPFEAFYVRPNILMTVEYTIDGQILEAIIEPRDMQKKKGNKSSGVLTNSEMLPETVTKIVEEIAPSNQRGRAINSITFNASCGSAVSEKYEHVEINLFYTCSKNYKGDRVISSAQIRWKQRK